MRKKKSSDDWTSWLTTNSKRILEITGLVSESPEADDEIKNHLQGLRKLFAVLLSTDKVLATEQRAMVELELEKYKRFKSAKAPSTKPRLLKSTDAGRKRTKLEHQLKNLCIQLGIDYALVQEPTKTK